MTVAFVSDFGPLPLLQKDAYTDALEVFGGALRPKAIIIMSGHWQTREKISLTGSERPAIIYDYSGFPKSAYDIKYPVLGAPDVARSAADLLTVAGFTVELDMQRGIDHGAWVPLYRLFPLADIPVVQLSLPTGGPERVYAMGKALAPLVEQDILLLGAGALSHNFGLLRFNDITIDLWATEFNAWINEQLDSNPMALLNYARHPMAARAAPTPEHFEPLFFVLGAAGNRKPIHQYDAIQHGNALMKIISYGD